MQLSSDQNMVIKIKPPSKPGSANAAGVPRGSLEEFEGPPWSNHRPQEGEGEPPGAQRQLPKPGRVKGSCGSEDPGPVCQKEAGKPRVVKSAGSVSDGPSEPRRTVSESAVAVKTRFPSPTLPPPRRRGCGPEAGLTLCIQLCRTPPWRREGKCRPRRSVGFLWHGGRPS